MRSKLAFYSGLVARFALVSAASGMIMSPVAITSREEREGEKIAVNVRAAEHAGVAEMNLNYGHLHTVPHALTESTYCRKKIQKLYLKGNIIHELVLHDVYRKLYTAIICHHISYGFCHFIVQPTHQLKLMRNLKELYLHSNSLEYLPSGIYI